MNRGTELSKFIYLVVEFQLETKEGKIPHRLCFMRLFGIGQVTRQITEVSHCEGQFMEFKIALAEQCQDVLVLPKA